MKKFMIGVIAVFAVLGLLIASMLISASRVSRYLRECDDHRRDVLVNFTHVYAEYYARQPQVSGTDGMPADSGVPADSGMPADSEKTTVSLDPYNVTEFMTAVTRTGLLYRWRTPPEGESITVYFSDGAVYTVVDGGFDKDGHDVAYIIYEYGGRRYRFVLTGYMTYDRVSKCVSPEGFGTNNWIVDERPAA